MLSGTLTVDPDVAEPAGQKLQLVHGFIHLASTDRITWDRPLHPEGTEGVTSPRPERRIKWHSKH